MKISMTGHRTTKYEYGWQSCKKYKQTREPVPDGQDTKFVYSTQLEKDKFKKMSQDRIQGSSSLKPFSRLPYT